MATKGVAIRISGTVQGVGFRPNVWRLAHQHGVVGEVLNDAGGVLIRAYGTQAALDALLQSLQTDLPPLAQIERIEQRPLAMASAIPGDFSIVASAGGRIEANVTGDAATCGACLDDILDPANRRHRYPFTNCTHCGPRLSIVRAIPYDRATTSMASFTMCAACQREYDDPGDRRYHAQPNACAQCGPQVALLDRNGQALAFDEIDAVAAAVRHLRSGDIVAIKGIGGFHLACDAANAQAVARLRERKHRAHKPFALMARDVAMVRRYAEVSDREQQMLEAHEAPIVIVQVQGECLPDAIAPDQSALGFMLAYTPLHHLLLLDMEAPLVMTSGNISDEPQVIDNRQAVRRLDAIADVYLTHDRDIVNRLDDSVVRVVNGAPRMLRRARGFAPAPVTLARGFRDCPDILAMGGELKNTFCLLREGKAIVSQHLGDMEDARTLRDAQRSLALYRQLYEFVPGRIAVDRHPEYIPTKIGLQLAATEGCDVFEVQHHHAHIAACLAEHGCAPDTPPVLGVVLDGLGAGDDGQIWGGEFLLANYHGYRKLAGFAPVIMPGGSRAILEPWRNTWAHLDAALGWAQTCTRFADLPLIQRLMNKPVATLARMASRGLNCPPASSCGRLFDAAAAALDLCPDRVSYEAQGAMALEALASGDESGANDDGYPHTLDSAAPTTVNWAPMWSAFLEDLAARVPAARIAARFHRGVANAVITLSDQLAQNHDSSAIVLSGGVFQNRLLLEAVSRGLGERGHRVLTPSAFGANDGGLALGQAAVAAACA